MRRFYVDCQLYVPIRISNYLYVIERTSEKRTNMNEDNENITIWYYCSLFASSDAVWYWFMAFMHELDERFTSALRWRKIWFKKMCYSVAQRKFGSLQPACYRVSQMPETPPGCQMEFILGRESHKISKTQDFWQTFGSVAGTSTRNLFSEDL